MGNWTTVHQQLWWPAEMKVLLSSSSCYSFTTRASSIKREKSIVNVLLYANWWYLVINFRFAEEFLRVLGFDWLLLFMQPQVKSSSVILSANCLLILLSNPQSLARFREGVSTGAGWARSRDLITSQGFANNAAAGPLRLVGRTFSVASEDVPTSPSTNLQSQQLPGFQLLGWMLVNHTSLPEIYYLIIGLMVGKPQLRTSSQVKI